MKILYDGFIFNLQASGGINRYFAEIISRLPSDHVPVIYGSGGDSLQTPRHERAKFKSRFPWAFVARPLIANWTSGFDLFHPTYYHLTEPLEWRRIKAPVVLTVHDFTFQRLGHLYNKSAKLLAAQQAAIERADFIVCVSQSTQADLAEFYPQAAARSCVIHLAAMDFSSHAVQSPVCHAPYVLFVGARVFYKNFALAVRTLKRLREHGNDLRLVVAGAPWTNEEKQLIAREGMNEAVILRESPCDAELATLYRKAVCLLYPSLYEGFGLPPLESMSLGTPVVALRQSSLPEVVGEGGVLVDPTECSTEAFADAIQRLVENKDYCGCLGQKALRQSRKFSWERTTLQTLNVYQAAAQS
jgi:glycosyltransferase involved in cell wall biosynthesis